MYAHYQGARTKSDVHIRKRRARFVVGKGVLYSTSKESVEKQRYATEFFLLQVSAASSVVSSRMTRFRSMVKEKSREPC